MTIEQLKTNIQNNKIDNFYIFIENEPINAQAYIKLMSNKINKPIKLYDNADECLFDISNDWFDDYLYIILNDEKILKNQKYVDAFIDCDKNVILCFEYIKIPDSFIKSNMKYCVVFEKGNVQTLSSVINKNLSKYNIDFVTNEDIKKIIEYSDYNLGAIYNELDKIIMLNKIDDKLSKNYVKNVEYSDCRKFDNWNWMLKVINKDTSAMNEIYEAQNGSVGTLKALFTMSRKKFIETDNFYYAKIMVNCFNAYNAIIDGTMEGNCAFRNAVLKIFS